MHGMALLACVRSCWPASSRACLLVPHYHYHFIKPIQRGVCDPESYPTPTSLSSEGDSNVTVVNSLCGQQFASEALLFISGGTRRNTRTPSPRCSSLLCRIGRGAAGWRGGSHTAASRTCHTLLRAHVTHLPTSTSNDCAVHRCPTAPTD